MTKQIESTDKGRRKFVTGAAVAGLTLAPGVQLINVANAQNNQPASDKVRWGMLIDTNKCGNGCNKCVEACDEEFGLTPTKETMSNPEQQTHYIRKVDIVNKQTKREVSLPLMCQHCEKPPCVDVCPTGASMKRPDGIVKVDMHRCIGCRFCMMACPYKARSFVHEEITNQKEYAPRGKGCVESCNLCSHRIDAKGDKAVPACVEKCPTKGGEKAMIFGDLKDENSTIYKTLKKHSSTQLRADLGLNTGVRYRGL